MSSIQIQLMIPHRVGNEVLARIFYFFTSLKQVMMNSNHYYHIAIMFLVLSD